MFSVIKTPKLIPVIFNKYLWHKSREERVLYLTFDDGPTPEITSWVLSLLQTYQAKATFFCIGKNVAEQPLLFEQIVTEGHRIGNHTHNHLKGLKTKTTAYFDNVEQAEHTFLNHFESDIIFGTEKLFRPPYGKASVSQLKAVQANGFTPVFWDVLSRDFDDNITEEQCFKNVINNTKNGSIIVFHDSKKAAKNLKSTLPKVLEYFKNKDYRFEAL